MQTKAEDAPEDLSGLVNLISRRYDEITGGQISGTFPVFDLIAEALMDGKCLLVISHGMTLAEGFKPVIYAKGYLVENKL